MLINEEEFLGGTAVAGVADSPMGFNDAVVLKNDEDFLVLSLFWLLRRQNELVH